MGQVMEDEEQRQASMEALRGLMDEDSAALDWSGAESSFLGKPKPAEQAPMGVDAAPEEAPELEPPVDMSEEEETPDIPTSAAKPSASSAGAIAPTSLSALLGRAPSSGAAELAALERAQGADRRAYESNRLIDLIGSSVSGRRTGPASPPSESKNVLQRIALQKQKQDEQLRYAEAARKLMGTHGADPSLAERRKALTDIAYKELELRKLKMLADNGDREAHRKAELLRLQIAGDRLALDRDKLRAKGAKGSAVGAVKPGDLNTVPEQYRQVVKAIAEGRMEAPKASSRFGADVLKYVVAYKPDFDATRFGNYAAVSRQQATAPDVVAMDVGRHHLDTAKKLIPDNADAQFLNRMKQSFAQGTGDPEFAAFNTAANVAAHEVAKMMKIDDQAGKQMVEHMMAPVQSKAQLLQVFATIDELIAGKQEGLKRQIEPWLPPRTTQGGPAVDHGAVVKETKTFRRYADGHIEKKAH